MDIPYFIQVVAKAGGDISVASKHCAGIYIIRNTQNGKGYVGGAVDLRGRFNKHLRELRRGDHHSLKLQRAWNKYGEDSFEIEVLEVVADPRGVVETEQRWLDKLKSYTRNGGYNICREGRSRLGVKASPETCQKISAALKGRKMTPEQVEAMRKRVTGFRHTKEAKKKIKKASQGRTHTPQAREKIGSAHRGKTVSKKTRKKIGDANKGNQHWLGRQHSPETRKKLSKIQSERVYTPEQKEHLAQVARETHCGKTVSRETREKISRAKRGRPVSDETRQKLRDAWKKRKARQEGLLDPPVE